MSTAYLQHRASVSLDAYVVDCTWSPDGNALAVAGGEGAVAIIDNVSSQPAVRQLGEHGMGTLAIAWQPRGNILASSGQEGVVSLWDATTGAALKSARPGTAWPEHLSWSSDGQHLAIAAGKTLALWAADGTLIHEFKQHGSTIAAIAWDKPGRDLAATTNGILWIHRIEPPKFTSRPFKMPASGLTAAFSPNSKVLASGLQDGTVRFWYLATGRDSQMQGYGSKVQLTAWSSNSRYLATSAGPQIVVWDFSGKGPERSKPITLDGHTERVDSLAFQPEGPWLVSGGRDWRVSLWAPGKSPKSVDAALTKSEVTVLRWSPDSRFVAVGERQGQVGIYEVVTT